MDLISFAFMESNIEIPSTTLHSTRNSNSSLEPDQIQNKKFDMTKEKCIYYASDPAFFDSDP